MAVDGGAFVAVLVLEDEWIDQLYVDPAHTGHAIGGRLLDVAKQQRLAGLRLWTFASNVGGRRFYERHGFVVTGATDGDNAEGALDLRYDGSPTATTP